MTTEEQIELLREAHNEIIRLAEKAWMPMRAFRSEAQAELDDAKYDALTDAADISRKAVNALPSRAIPVRK